MGDNFIRKCDWKSLKHIRAHPGKVENDMYFEDMDRDALRFSYLKGTGKVLNFSILVESRRQRTAVIGDVEIPYEESYGVCDSCHEELYVPSLDDQNELLIEELYRNEKGLLTIAEIKNIVEQSHLTPEEVSIKLGLAENIVSLYLEGMQPSKQNSDKLKNMKGKI